MASQSTKVVQSELKWPKQITNIEWSIGFGEKFQWSFGLNCFNINNVYTYICEKKIFQGQNWDIESLLKTKWLIYSIINQINYFKNFPHFIYFNYFKGNKIVVRQNLSKSLGVCHQNFQSNYDTCINYSMDH